MKKIVNETLGIILFVANFFMPKKKNKVVIISYPDFDDQTRAIVEESQGKSITILSDGKKYDYPLWLPNNVDVINRKSLLGVYSLLIARTILYTHGLFSFFKLLNSNRQLVINITHGMYIKNMHLLDGKKTAPISHYILCTSVLFQQVLAKTFGLDKSKVLITGLPRNKVLLQNSTSEDVNSFKHEYSNIHVWLPTYRKSNTGDVRVDVKTETVFGTDELNLDKLNEILKQNNDVLLVKPHPMAQCSLPVEQHSNIKFITNAWLESRSITLYELLSASSSLWTDYSSVFVDYMVTSKPILFVVFDIELYKGSRGLTIDLEAMPLPGVVVKDIEAFYQGVVNIMSQKPYNMAPFIENGICFDVFNVK